MKIESIDRLAPLTAQVKNNPTDEKAKAELIKRSKPWPSNHWPILGLLKVAQAQAALGDHAKAEKNIAIVQRINPKLVMAPTHP